MHHVNPGRRDVLRAIASSTILSSSAILSVSSAAADVPSLAKIAASRGLRYGAESSDAPFSKLPPEFVALFLQQCSLFAPRLDWKYVCPTPGSADPARVDPDIAVALAHGLQLTGGHLLYPRLNPEWVSDITDKAALDAAVHNHIRAMGSYFHTGLYSINVVNEMIAPKDGRPDGLRNTKMLQTLGPGFISESFKLARPAFPGALLVYNDNDFETVGRSSEARRTALLRLLDRLAQDRAPIDAVGLQSHLKLNGVPLDTAQYPKFIHDIASRGLRILITELDVFDLEQASDPQTRDRDVADMYSRFLNMVLAEPAVCAVVTWGMSDRYSWLRPSFNAAYVRRDGLPSRPLPFDQDFRPKPAYYALASALQHAPPRKF